MHRFLPLLLVAAVACGEPPAQAGKPWGPSSRESDSAFDAAVSVPRDWKAVPQSAVVWRKAADAFDAGRGFVAVGDVLVAMRDGAFVGVHGATGRELWSRPVEAGQPDPRAFGGCDGVAVLVEPRGIVGVDADSGEVRWRRELGPRGGVMPSGAGSPQLHGCLLTLHVQRGRQRIARWEATDLLVVDSRDGSERLWSGCDRERSMVSRLPRTGMLSGVDAALLHDEGSSRLVHLQTGAVTALPSNAWAHLSTPQGPLVVVRSEMGKWRGLRSDGSGVWRRSAAMTPLLRIENTAVAWSSRSLARVDLETGRTLWSLGLSEDLSESRRGGEEVALHEQRLLVVLRGRPDVLLVVNVATGRLDALRLAPAGTASIAVAGNVAYLGTETETVAVDLDREGPSLRDALSLEDDIRRSIGELASERLRPPPGTDPVPYDRFPMGRIAAREWLMRLGPLARPTLAEIGLHGPIEEAATVASALSGAKPTLIEALLRRSFAAVPDKAHADLLTATAQVVGIGGLRAPIAEELAANAVAWIHHAREEDWLAPRALGWCRRRPETATCQEVQRMAAALQSTRDLLERGSSSAEPLRRFRRALFDGSLPSLRCTPSDDDAARLAVIAHRSELELRSSQALVPGIGCAPPVPTLHGAIQAQPSEAEMEEGPAWRLEVSNIPDADPIPVESETWASAPMRFVVEEQILISPDLAYRDSHRRGFVVFKVDGLWRVVGQRAAH